MNATNVREEFKKHGIKTSYQRIKIFNYLYGSHSHPSVDEIYTHLCDEIPTLSKTTVYNNLSMFIEKGLAREVKIEKNESRYELNIGPHGHFKCISCGSIIDFEAEFLKSDLDCLDGFDVESKSLYYTGICPKCRKAKAKES